MNRIEGIIFGLFFIALMILFGIFTDYAPVDTAIPNYSMFQDIHVMIAIGFGFLMAFLRNNSFTTTGYSLLVMVLVAFWSILNMGFWHRAIGVSPWTNIDINLASLINADFAAGAVLISFGALVGRCSASMLLIMAIFETIFYHINEAILVDRLKVADVGGTMIIHCFGAYFGLACSLALEAGNTARKDIFERDSHANGSTKISDTFAMIGTLFLWCFWPSFNAGLAGHNSEIAIINTYLSISGSVLAAFLTVTIVTGGKFRMVEVQNSTLAGGVAIGAAANMLVWPAGAMATGAGAGIISVLGYQFISPRLPVMDTCGINNLHGMPAILGAIVSALASHDGGWRKNNRDITATFLRAKEAGGRLEYSETAGFQIISLLVTLGIALFGGLLTGKLLSLLTFTHLKKFYTDSQEWVDAEDPDVLSLGSPKPVEMKAAFVAPV